MTKKRRKGAKKSGTKRAAKKSGKSNQRPLSFLKSMLAKQKKNVPKLEAIIKQRGG